MSTMSTLALCLYVALFGLARPALAGQEPDAAPTSRAVPSGKAHVAIEIEAPAADVWDLIDEFDEMHQWHPLVDALAVLRGDGDSPGSIRALRYPGGATVHQELVRVDHERMRKDWRMVGWTELPFDDYSASISVLELTPTLSMVVWQSRFEPKQWRIDGRDAEVTTEMVERMYRVGLMRLKALAERR